ncbi:heterokaryon incompatibility protein-domain-containing protein [Cadophora sp. MPI-SDFR-AT-0126]|nr:heterokaryon incompatibility protein-domain-containing protein [Leotiomycetes sp. MPI-SDFR-AT-0126]
MKTISGGAISKSDHHKLPTRLVDVGSIETNIEPRLVNTAGFPDGQWIALSHCWGEPQNHPPKTTRENLAERLAVIPLNSMPKSFVDAIAVTRSLGFQYIWIDSLCIVQDDEEDWLAESEHMGSIYEKAISASSAPDSSGGLFIPRPYGELNVPTVLIPFIDPSMSASGPLGKYSIGLEWRQEPFVQEFDPMDTALSKRGWATQEWILSRRTIHFLDRGMVWVCKINAEAETGYFVVSRGIPIQEYRNAWGQIVQEHSARLFTYQRVRLVSLEGLASRYRHFKPTDDWYAAGIWGSDMPLHLLWSPRILGWDRDRLGVG